MAGGPLGVLLRDQALESLRELAVAILAGVGPGLGQVQVTLVLERLGGGAVGDPVLLELVEVLVVATLAVVPADLVLQPVPGRVLCVWKGHGLDRPYRPCSVLAACHPPSLRSAPDSSDLCDDEVVELRLDRRLCVWASAHQEADSAGQEWSLRIGRFDNHPTVHREHEVHSLLSLLTGAPGPRQSRGLHHMSDHACRLNLAPGLDQRSRVVPDHDVGSSDKRDESRLCRDPASAPPRPRPPTMIHSVTATSIRCGIRSHPPRMSASRPIPPVATTTRPSRCTPARGVRSARSGARPSRPRSPWTSAPTRPTSSWWRAPAAGVLEGRWC